MPAATPLPGRPATLVLGSADALLAGPGCGICRYAAESSGQYLSWFAVEAHADPATINRLCASLGMCPGHTRTLISQPGAATRLTPVYQCVMRAAQVTLGARRPRLEPCPPCKHDEAVTYRAVDIIADWVAEGARADSTGSPQGRLCMPHMRALAAKAQRRVSRRLARAVAEHAPGGPASLDELAGGMDHDVGTRARLRAALPPAGDLPPWTCRICLTGARGELGSLAAAAGTTATAPSTGGRIAGPLCPAHLRDTAVIQPEDAPSVLAVEFARQAEELHRLASWPRLRHHRGQGRRGARGLAGEPGRCPACHARDHAMQQELERYQMGLSMGRSKPGGALCARHVLSLRDAGPAAGHAAAARARSLAAELGEAFDKGTWRRRHEPKGPEATAWLRAAAFLDGRVFGGGPPPGVPGIVRQAAEPGRSAPGWPWTG